MNTSTQTLETVGRLLGGHAITRGKRADMASAVRKGLPYSAYAALVRELDIEPALQTRLFAVSVKTLQRAKARAKHRTPLDRNVSDRVMRVAQVFADAVNVFAGDTARAAEWLRAPNRALGDTRPIDQLDTHVGAQEVLDVLNRIRYGVFS